MVWHVDPSNLVSRPRTRAKLVLRTCSKDVSLGLHLSEQTNAIGPTMNQFIRPLGLLDRAGARPSTDRESEMENSISDKCRPFS